MYTNPPFSLVDKLRKETQINKIINGANRYMKFKKAPTVAIMFSYDVSIKELIDNRKIMFRRNLMTLHVTRLASGIRCQKAIMLGR
ncbi:hypothetical protein A9E74_02520 [Methylophaga muralis]|uniref:Uncharacterized protein n=1 Tax=Methylophaga muralis TaxID=291169 RepID=A0A1E3GNV2_9GAMM|nr:hypothetical protein A9E74_02520 [Methylophaga muralis]